MWPEPERGAVPLYTVSLGQAWESVGMYLHPEHLLLKDPWPQGIRYAFVEDAHFEGVRDKRSDKGRV
jgi:hypothetical protein